MGLNVPNRKIFAKFEKTSDSKEKLQVNSEIYFELISPLHYEVCNFLLHKFIKYL